VASLKSRQHKHLIALFIAEHDAAYFEARLRVGMAHARIGMQPQWYIGAYMVQLAELNKILFARFATDPAHLLECVQAIEKVVMLDVELAIHAYIYSGFLERSLAEAYAAAAANAQSALEARDEEEARKEELLRMVVHDIRSPVTAMISSARLGLRRHPDGATSPGKQFRLVEESGGHVLEIIDSILTTARVTHGNMPLRRHAFDVTSIVHECVEELRAFAVTNRHSLHMKDRAPVPVDGLDASLVRRIVSNLLTNAIRHTPSGTTVVAACRGNEESCTIVVEDDGPGIADAVIESTVLGNPVGAPRSEGAYLDSGLGLPFCGLATQRMGGRLTIERAERGGTRITVELPVLGPPD
jgi:signal transduction histidine kinase